MKIIEQAHTWIKEKDPLKLIEMAGRTCYKSEDKITEDSASRFVKMIVKAGHYSVLEHANKIFEVSAETYAYLKQTPNSKYFNFSEGEGAFIVSGNFRAWLELILEQVAGNYTLGMQAIRDYFVKNYPDVFPDLPIWGERTAIVLPENALDPAEKLIHATRTCRFITNRGVTHEMVRHRPTWAYSHESTRYVNYKGGMEFIRPMWSKCIKVLDKGGRVLVKDDASRAEQLWLDAMYLAETRYGTLIKLGWRPEQARGVLPHDLKTEIVCTATLENWQHMLDLRTSKAAHPQIRALMQPVLVDLEEELPEVFTKTKLPSPSRDWS